MDSLLNQISLCQFRELDFTLENTKSSKSKIALKEKSFSVLIIIKMPITDYFIHFEVFFFGSCNIEIFILLFLKILFTFLFQILFNGAKIQ